jgi:ankyrin repeat protein
MLLECGAGLNYVNDDGESPLHLAVKSGEIELVKKLLKAGAMGGSRNLEGLSPRELARESKNPEVLKAFQELDNSGEGLRRLSKQVACSQSLILPHTATLITTHTTGRCRPDRLALRASSVCINTT